MIQQSSFHVFFVLPGSPTPGIVCGRDPGISQFNFGFVKCFDTPCRVPLAGAQIFFVLPGSPTPGIVCGRDPGISQFNFGFVKCFDTPCRVPLAGEQIFEGEPCRTYHLSRYERNLAQPSIEVVKKNAEALDISIDTLIYGQQDEKAKNSMPKPSFAISY